jgi:RHS repeat-associated protein
MGKALTPTANYNPLYDAQGNIIALVSSTAKVERTFRYGPYGENVKSEGTQTIPFIFGYKGGYHMPGGNKGETTVTNGLYYYGQRYYDPTTGRWTQQDPLSQARSCTQGNRYSFAGGDPINNSDPSGREWVENAWEGCLYGGAVGAAIGTSAWGAGAIPGAVMGCGGGVAGNIIKEGFEEIFG